MRFSFRRGSGWSQSAPRNFDSRNCNESRCRVSAQIRRAIARTSAALLVFVTAGIPVDQQQFAVFFFCHGGLVATFCEKMGDPERESFTTGILFPPNGKTDPASRASELEAVDTLANGLVKRANKLQAIRYVSNGKAGRKCSPGPGPTKSWNEMAHGCVSKRDGLFWAWVEGESIACTGSKEVVTRSYCLVFWLKDVAQFARWKADLFARASLSPSACPSRREWPRRSRRQNSCGTRGPAFAFASVLVATQVQSLALEH